MPYLSLYMPADVAAKACAAFLDACYEETQDSGPVQEEEEGEDLCNCEFSLAYGEGVGAGEGKAQGVGCGWGHSAALGRPALTCNAPTCQVARSC